MLRQRLVTAAILTPFVVWAVLFFSTTIIAWLLALLVTVGAWEWSGLVRLRVPRMRLLYAGAVLLLLWGSYAIPVESVAAAGVVWWLGCTVLLRQWAHRRSARAPLLTMPLPGLMAGVLVLVPTWRTTVGLHALPSVGPAMVLFLLVLVWLTDSAAYLAGRCFGRTRLAPALSPGKTWEGMYGALSIGVPLSFIGGRIFSFSGWAWWGFMGLTLLTLLMSVMGDLLESLFKRLAAVKDSGHLLPGHGGVLDRVDSLTAAAPVFVLGVWALERLP